MSNPLLTMSGLPPFSQLKPEHIVPAITQILQDNRHHITQLVIYAQPYSWDNFVQQLNELDDRLRRVWSIVGHLQGVADSSELREAYKQCLPLLSAYRSELGHHQGLYLAYQSIANHPSFQGLERAQQTVIEHELRDFRLSGIHLNPEQQQRYTQIQQSLSELSTQFHEQLLDATQGWSKSIAEESQLIGLPESAKNLAKQRAEERELPGWLLTLDLPSYLPTMNYLDDRNLRQEIYTAYTTRASDQGTQAGQWDNGPVMEKILALRHELAVLLGFKNYAEYSLSTKMAESIEQVEDFLLDLAQRSRHMALQDLAELRDFARDHCGMEHLELWDVPYYSEKLRLHRYALSQEDLRPYFPLPKVLNGLFKIIELLFNMHIRERVGVDVWHPEVQFFEVVDESGQVRGQFYIDLFARQGKRSGAWMDDCISRHRTERGLQLPVAYLVCNFTPPVGDVPCLLTHQEVTTLFHEFGHGLHHVLTQVDYAPVAGTYGVAWDAVELPSQFLESWAWEKAALDLFAGHYQTGAPLPENLYQKMVAAKNFQAGLFMVRQLEFALFDLRLHAHYHTDLQIQTVLDEVRAQVAVLIPPRFNRFQHSFSHIFSGGYAAGYYSYKWAEVLSTDAFSKFEERGIFDRQTGLEFLHHILEKGGSEDPMTLFVRFRGRPPEIEALLRKSGILPE